MFEALESAKLLIFVWNPKTPRHLIPWRDYQQKKINVKRCLKLEVLRPVPLSDKQQSVFTLATLREQQGLTQQELAKRAKLTQSEVSRIEKRGDCLVSTLKRYTAALSGELLLHVEIDGHRYPVTL